MSTSNIRIDPSAKKRITFDWTDWCTNEGNNISGTPTITPSTGVTTTSVTKTGNKVTCLVTATQSGTVKAHAVFDDTQEDERTMTITVENQ